ncbi:hypothetical protein CBR_g34280 [Chara braunii]|uniref:Uncharacterized protein n=1 Tax=Chara braunii TaxID=69332 RepID=A0A388JYP4_CHABU|nr:hypothetical protein CBR_g34280 [Chara braunii]|eukprot:GBG62908.1 hypothetical protein CBR_g34280 [Chara braunii]
MDDEGGNLQWAVYVTTNLMTKFVITVRPSLTVKELQERATESHKWLNPNLAHLHVACFKTEVNGTLYRVPVMYTLGEIGEPNIKLWAFLAPNAPSLPFPLPRHQDNHAPNVGSIPTLRRDSRSPEQGSSLSPTRQGSSARREEQEGSASLEDAERVEAAARQRRLENDLGLSLWNEAVGDGSRHVPERPKQHSDAGDLSIVDRAAERVAADHRRPPYAAGPGAPDHCAPEGASDGREDGGATDPTQGSLSEQVMKGGGEEGKRETDQGEVDRSAKKKRKKGADSLEAKGSKKKKRIEEASGGKEVSDMHAGESIQDKAKAEENIKTADRKEEEEQQGLLQGGVLKSSGKAEEKVGRKEGNKHGGASSQGEAKTEKNVKIAEGEKDCLQGGGEDDESVAKKKKKKKKKQKQNEDDSAGPASDGNPDKCREDDQSKAQPAIDKMAGNAYDDVPGKRLGGGGVAGPACSDEDRDLVGNVRVQKMKQKKKKKSLDEVKVADDNARIEELEEGLDGNGAVKDTERRGEGKNEEKEEVKDGKIKKQRGKKERYMSMGETEQKGGKDQEGSELKDGEGDGLRLVSPENEVERESKKRGKKKKKRTEQNRGDDQDGKCEDGEGKALHSGLSENDVEGKSKKREKKKKRAEGKKTGGKGQGEEGQEDEGGRYDKGAEEVDLMSEDDIASDEAGVAEGHEKPREADVDGHKEAAAGTATDRRKKGEERVGKSGGSKRKTAGEDQEDQGEDGWRTVKLRMESSCAGAEEAKDEAKKKEKRKKRSKGEEVDRKRAREEYRVDEGGSGNQVEELDLRSGEEDAVAGVAEEGGKRPRKEGKKKDKDKEQKGGGVETTPSSNRVKGSASAKVEEDEGRKGKLRQEKQGDEGEDDEQGNEGVLSGADEAKANRKKKKKKHMKEKEADREGKEEEEEAWEGERGGHDKGEEAVDLRSGDEGTHGGGDEQGQKKSRKSGNKKDKEGGETTPKEKEKGPGCGKGEERVDGMLGDEGADNGVVEQGHKRSGKSGKKKDKEGAETTPKDKERGPKHQKGEERMGAKSGDEGADDGVVEQGHKRSGKKKHKEGTQTTPYDNGSEKVTEGSGSREKLAPDQKGHNGPPSVLGVEQSEGERKEVKRKKHKKGKETDGRGEGQDEEGKEVDLMSGDNETENGGGKEGRKRGSKVDKEAAASTSGNKGKGGEMAEVGARCETNRGKGEREGRGEEVGAHKWALEGGKEGSEGIVTKEKSGPSKGGTDGPVVKIMRVSNGLSDKDLASLKWVKGGSSRTHMETLKPEKGDAEKAGTPEKSRVTGSMIAESAVHFQEVDAKDRGGGRGQMEASSRGSEERGGGATRSGSTAGVAGAEIMRRKIGKMGPETLERGQGSMMAGSVSMENGVGNAMEDVMGSELTGKKPSEVTHGSPAKRKHVKAEQVDGASQAVRETNKTGGEGREQVVAKGTTGKGGVCSTNSDSNSCRSSSESDEEALGGKKFPLLKDGQHLTSPATAQCVTKNKPEKETGTEKGCGRSGNSSSSRSGSEDSDLDQKGRRGKVAPPVPTRASPLAPSQHATQGIREHEMKMGKSGAEGGALASEDRGEPTMKEGRQRQETRDRQHALHQHMGGIESSGKKEGVGRENSESGTEDRSELESGSGSGSGSDDGGVSVKLSTADQSPDGQKQGGAFSGKMTKSVATIVRTIANEGGGKEEVAPSANAEFGGGEADKLLHKGELEKTVQREPLHAKRQKKQEAPPNPRAAQQETSSSASSSDSDSDTSTSSSSSTSSSDSASSDASGAEMLPSVQALLGGPKSVTQAKMRTITGASPATAKAKSKVAVTPAGRSAIHDPVGTTPARSTRVQELLRCRMVIVRRAVGKPSVSAEGRRGGG